MYEGKEVGDNGGWADVEGNTWSREGCESKDDTVFSNVRRIVPRYGFSKWMGEPVVF